jgi:hypothetical protein
MNHKKITTKELLNRDLQNCFSLTELENFKYILKHSSEELTNVEIADIFLNFNYRKALILYAERFTKKRYNPAVIWRFFQNATSYMICDAIMLHIEKNQQFYTSEYIDTDTLEKHFALSSIDVFKSMAKKRKSLIITQLVEI